MPALFYGFGVWSYPSMVVRVSDPWGMLVCLISTEQLYTLSFAWLDGSLLLGGYGSMTLRRCFSMLRILQAYARILLFLWCMELSRYRGSPILEVCLFASLWLSLAQNHVRMKDVWLACIRAFVFESYLVWWSSHGIFYCVCAPFNRYRHTALNIL